MERYTTFTMIQKEDIAEFRGLLREQTVSPWAPESKTAIAVSKMGITNPDSDYYIRRTPSRCFIIEYVESGTGYLEIDGVKHTLNKNDVYMIHVGDNCEYYSSKVDPYKKLWVNFRSFCFFDVASAFGLEEDRIFRNTDLSEHFKRLFALEPIAMTGDEFHIEASKIIFEMLHELALSKIRATEANKKNSRLAFTARFKLDHSINVPITVEKLAAILFVSRAELISEFKNEYGITPYAYLLGRRIELAESLLRSTDKKIKEISEYLCFSSEYHFSSCFKKKCGLSPREFRKKHKEK